ncbi:MAG TPA: amidohydrolase family protein [Steroidobacteraceae bacterium]|nr:amidohydrolase family protein [Steroidobacteraceae bacterium]
MFDCRVNTLSACTRRSFLQQVSAAVAAGAAASFALAEAPSAQPRPLVDVHCHSLPPFWVDAMRPSISAQLAGPLKPPWTNWSLQRTLDQMDAYGIAFAVQSITAPGVWAGDRRQARVLARRCNEYMASAVAAHPHRLGVHAILPLPDVDASLKELSYAFDVLKADGVGLMTSYGEHYLGDTLFEPVMQAMDARRAVAFVHPLAPQCCTHLMPAVPPNFIEFLHDTSRAVLNLMLTGTLHRYPNIQFIFCHAGAGLPVMVPRIEGVLPQYPQLAANVPEGVRPTLRRLHFDVTNSTSRPTLSAILSMVPDTQLLFGTDSPIVSVPATVRGLTTDILSSDQIQAIAHGNAERLYPRAAQALRLRAPGSPVP